MDSTHHHHNQHRPYLGSLLRLQPHSQNTNKKEKSVSNTRTTLWTLAAALAIVVALALMACGPTAQPDSPTQPVIAQANPDSNPEPTPEPTPDEWHSTVEPHPDNPMLPLHDPMLTPKPPRTPKPTRIDLWAIELSPEPTLIQEVHTPTPEPTWAPPPAHPEGLAGCKEYGLFEMYKGNSPETDYMLDCHQLAIEEVQEKCLGLDTAEAQHACGIKVASEHRSHHVRFGPTQCYGIDDDRFPNYQNDCLIAMWDKLDKAMEDFYTGWTRVHELGNAAPKVQAGIEELLSCIVQRGHKDAHRDRILHQQLLTDPREYHARIDAMSAEEKALEERLLKPTWECGHELGFFEIQEAAWIAGLEKLADEDPNGMEVIIREGMLIHLKEPGIAIILGGEQP